eukprot:scaffold459_cov249-Pinguiococcus_pyrenoidosus.AAC.23
MRRRSDADAAVEFLDEAGADSNLVRRPPLQLLAEELYFVCQVRQQKQRAGAPGHLRRCDAHTD